MRTWLLSEASCRRNKRWSGTCAAASRPSRRSRLSSRRLNRDYEINKQQYDTLLQRLESAKISEQAEQSADNVKFRVIEPPIVPVRPSGPDRVALNALVLLAALGAG